jgi:hypothetical protein
MSAPGLALALLLAQAAAAPEPETLRVVPVLRQGFVFFTSDQVTASGAGGGAGVQVTWRDRWLAQADASLLWGGGNVWVTRLAAGAQRSGAWSPAAWLSFGALFGDRVETLDDEGRRPPAPVWAAGLRLSPLRFAGRLGSVSALEVGWSRGAGGGTWVEVSVLEAAVRW